MRNRYFFGLLMLAIIAYIIISGCTGNTETNLSGNTTLTRATTAQETNQATDATNTEGMAIQKIEVFHFHRTQQCYSCKTVGAYAEETVKTYFSDELNSGKIVFEHINAELPENKERTTKYGATGSSLWIGVYMADGSFSKEENTNVWYKIKDKQDYMNYLKQVLDQKLEGN
ncbi:MAG: hypothetical protein KAH93_01815 [Candidatus Aenigmarchaeota archaeon]|nr:hypothetical protein [Candidatus Aenigmarchaeota archaeon]